MKLKIYEFNGVLYTNKINAVDKLKEFHKDLCAEWGELVSLAGKLRTPLRRRVEIGKLNLRKLEFTTLTIVLSEMSPPWEIADTYRVIEREVIE